MKTTKKRTLTLLLALTMILSSFSSVAFAAETPTGSVDIGSFTGGTVTINASNADDSFALYKVVDITYNSTSNSVKYDFTAGVKAYITSVGSTVKVSDYQSWKDNSTELKAFLAGYAEYVKGHPEVVSNYNVTAKGGIATVENVALGQYMVLGTGSSTGAYIYQIMTATFKPNNKLEVNNAVTLSSKSSRPTLAKSADKKSVSTNDIVNYTLTIGVPTYPDGATNKKFVVKDVLPAGFDYVLGSQGVAAVSDEAFSFEAKDDVLTWTFNFDKISAKTELIITYQAKATAPVITDGNTNTATLTYSKSPFGTDATHDITASATVYSYAIDITKEDKNDGTKLDGVVFEVYNSSNVKVATVTTENGGKATVSGLALGTYTLKETKAATGYADPINVNPLTVTLSDSDHNGKLDGENNIEDTDGVLSVTITNTKGVFNIPTTGDSGTLMFTFAAMALMALAVAIMLVMRRKQARR